jgi:CheY-like chemotaxis protein
MAVLHESTEPGATRVLIADDDVETAVMFSCLVQILGCIAAVAYDGATATKVAAQFEPHLSFINADMPEVSDPDFVEHLRAAEDRASLVYCVLARADRDVAVDALAAGFDGVIVKPLLGDQLSDALAHARASQALRRAALRTTGG